MLLSGLYMLPETLANSRFYIELILDNDSVIDAFFQDCSGFKRTVDTIEVAEVTPAKWGRSGNSYGAVRRTKIPGNVKSDTITLKRGLMNGMTLWYWFKAIEEGDWHNQFRSGDIAIYNQGAWAEARFRFTGAWPISYSIGELSSSGNELMIEELELSVDSFYRVELDGVEQIASGVNTISGGLG
ncbi:MAG: phage tail protein [Cyanobacteria bacterium P01_G01_bin.54]